ncbi:hypothetical protein JOF29_006167 [Kribbella aluminosa]|uniref:Neutral zinc metallopeptidase n=1 Tax=Kribbella aluminosa TaxID=416017 RepID=A0ABS4UTU7_9ACTN|nr:neutral zinc metallopeptidase [Kribbella aluminosa]MBP2355057.1 hypothetical protein [Kribbella aluminosa]
MSLEDTYLLHNQLYTAGQVPATPCYLPGGPLKTRSDVQRSANAMLVCLQSAWKPVVEHADASFAPTTLYVVTVGARTACGGFDADSDAFYCTDNSDIYLDWTQHLEESPDDRQYASADLLWVMAHEFGHHLQQLAGISAYYDDRLDRTTGAALPRTDPPPRAPGLLPGCRIPRGEPGHARPVRRPHRRLPGRGVLRR